MELEDAQTGYKSSNKSHKNTNLGKKYSSISDQTRHELLKCVIQNGEKVKQVKFIVITLLKLM